MDDEHELKILKIDYPKQVLMNVKVRSKIISTDFGYQGENQVSVSALILFGVVSTSHLKLVHKYYEQTDFLIKKNSYDLFLTIHNTT